ncbi:MAG: iron chaperone [Vicinamibacterales bacterium]
MTPTTIDEYIAGFPREVRAILQKIRKTVASAAPGAEERISYRMPAFAQNGILLYFAAFKKHIGVYPPVYGDSRLEKALAAYRGPKGNLHPL